MQYRTPEVQDAMASCKLLKNYINECYEYNSIISEEFGNIKKNDIKTSASTTCINTKNKYRNSGISSNSYTNIRNQYEKVNNRTSRPILPQEILLGLNYNRNNNSNYSNDKYFHKATSSASLPTFTSQTIQNNHGYYSKKGQTSVEAVNIDTSLFNIDSIFGRENSNSSNFTSLSSSSSYSSSEAYFSLDNSEEEKKFEEYESFKVIHKVRKFDQLPKEVLNNIMKFLPTSSLYNVLFVNRYIYNCALPYLWRNLNFQNTVNCFKFCSNFENNSVYQNNFALYTETFNIYFPNQGMNLYKFLLDKIISNCKNIKNIKVNKSLYWYMDKTVSLFTKNCKNIERIG